MNTNIVRTEIGAYAFPSAAYVHRNDGTVSGCAMNGSVDGISYGDKLCLIYQDSKANK
jgi:hypothetical protein